MQEILDFVGRAQKISDKKNLEVLPLFGQASARQYFRVKTLPSLFFSNQESSLVVMKIPGGFSSPAEEITKISSEAPKEWPFLNIQKFLKRIGVRVPEVLAVDADVGLVLLEDLGDKSLEAVVKNADGDFFIFYYRQVLNELVDLQMKTFGGIPKDCVAAYRCFDADLLLWEIRHFVEYGLEDRLGIKLDRVDAEEFDEEAKALAKRVAAMPTGFVHRDFQSRNILFKNYDFVLIDFQDALVGPVLYDVVGLLRDSYIEFSPEILESLLRYYFEKLETPHPYANRYDDLVHDFYVMSLQRKLKDTGRFQYIKTVRNNPGFLPHVPLSLRYVREALDHLPEYKNIRRVIKKYLENA